MKTDLNWDDYWSNLTAGREHTIHCGSVDPFSGNDQVIQLLYGIRGTDPGSFGSTVADFGCGPIR